MVRRATSLISRLMHVKILSFKRLKIIKTDKWWLGKKVYGKKNVVLGGALSSAGYEAINHICLIGLW